MLNLREWPNMVNAGLAVYINEILQKIFKFLLLYFTCNKMIAARFFSGPEGLNYIQRLYSWIISPRYPLGILGELWLNFWIFLDLGSMKRKTEDQRKMFGQNMVSVMNIVKGVTIHTDKTYVLNHLSI